MSWYNILQMNPRDVARTMKKFKIEEEVENEN